VTAAIHYSDDAVTLWHGDARQVSEFIPANTVDLLITSPPYFALRSYTDGGEHYDGQMGSEATPREFVDNLIAATADWVKVLKPTGSIWVNLGDKYAGSGGHNNSNISRWSEASLQGGKSTLARMDANEAEANRIKATRRQAPDRYTQASDGIPAKSLMGLPWRYANRVVDELGLILRECIIWQKPNGLPESVTDRCRVSHEYLFHFTRQGRYFAAMDELREEHASEPKAGALAMAGQHTIRPAGPNSGCYNSLGKLPGSVWSMPSEPLVVPDHLGVDHFAAFPSELPRRIILGWSPAAYCTACDEPRRAVVEYDGPHEMAPVRALTLSERAEWARKFKEWCVTEGISRADVDGATHSQMWDRWTSLGSQPEIPTPGHFDLLREAFPNIPEWFDQYVHKTEMRPVRGGNYTDKGGARKGPVGFVEKDTPTKRLTGYACACPTNDAPTRPAVVLDPFAGSGTTLLAARALGRAGHGVDLSKDYLRLAQWRIWNDDATYRKVRTRSNIATPKAPAIDGQMSFLDGAA
jgi:DNA modification methylase